MEKPIIMRFHQKEMFDELVESIRKSADKFGEQSMKIQESDEAFVVEVVDWIK